MMTRVDLIALGVFLAVCAGEWLHARRCIRLRHLLWKSAWQMDVSAVVPTLAGVAIWRALGVGLLTWGLITLAALPAVSVSLNTRPTGTEAKRLIIMLDVSPSMDLKDAGGKKQRRSYRAAQVVRELMSTVNLGKVRASVFAFYTTCRPVVLDTIDANVVLNISDGLPLSGVFEDGKTDLPRALITVFEQAAQWPADTVSVLVLTDGDSESPPKLPVMPASIGKLILAGVGDVNRGIFVDGHQSRQESAALDQIATRVGGRYFNADTGALPGDLLDSISGTYQAKAAPLVWSRRTAALMCVGLGGAMLLLQQLMQRMAQRRIAENVQQAGHNIVLPEGSCVV